MYFHTMSEQLNTPFVCKSGFGVWIAVGVSEKDGGTGACVSETY